ncbi:MAG: signal recognition particle-docking protein FtsY [Candidatus Nitrohelix vancouverensis]|uniref:Signal recognition particle receptor FtsY n=1 Tax=Candidatus Nitrohelix vancouverensis TaxID=2705534 RepID=A0A7T0C4Q9_9BACT|nr:MAG: signal recognition particle-docking protein FtsY [Candidatus Nitrohelix vancouverensis]
MNDESQANEVKEEKTGFFSRLKKGLMKTRQSMAGGLGSILGRKGDVGPELMTELEEALLSADVGMAATEFILAELRKEIKANNVRERPEAVDLLKKILVGILEANQGTIEFKDDGPLIVLMVGVNGSGKTTTIGKLGSYWKNQGKKVLMAAGDTFRAAAIEQLQEWARRSDIPCVHQKSGADPSAVAYDGVQAAVGRNVDVALIDTAGRLQTNTNLMAELQKVTRVIKKVAPSAPDQIFLVLDSSIGQNSISQARLFHEALGVTGLVMTKLDGAGKGGVLFYLARELKLPVYFIGVGEQAADLQPFNPTEFVNALLAEDA